MLASGENVNLLVLDTEVYSNTGGQMSKATPWGAVAKFATAGKAANKKDLGLMAMAYGNAYVASVALGSKDAQTVKAFVEAESYDGPSMIIAYSHCIAHGINMLKGLSQQKAAVDCGHWILYRHDPRRLDKGLNPLQLDSPAPKIPVAEYIGQENRYRMLHKTDHARAEALAQEAQRAATARYRQYKQRAEMTVTDEPPAAEAAAEAPDEGKQMAEVQ